MKQLISALVLFIAVIFNTEAQQEASVLITNAEEAEQTTNFAKALENFTAAKNLYEQQGSTSSKEYARCLHGIGRAYLNLEDAEQSLYYTKQALEIRKTLLGELSEEYISSLNNIAFAYAIQKNYPKAIDVQEQVCQLMDKMPTEHSQYGDFMANMGRYYYFGERKPEAATAWEKALPKVEKHGSSYEAILNCLGIVYDDLKDNKNLKRVMRLMDEHNEEELKKPCNDAECMLGKAEYYVYKGKVNKAKETYLQVFKMEMSDKVRSQAEEGYGRLLHTAMNDYNGAAEYYTLAAESMKRAEGETEKYFQLLYSASLFDFINKNATACIEKAQKVRSFYLDHDSESARKNLANIHKTLGNAYKLQKDYQQCLEYYNRVLDYRTAVDAQSSEVADILSDIAYVQRRLKDYDAAINADERALLIYKQLNDMDKYGMVASDLQLCFTLAGKEGTIDVDEQLMQNQRNSKIDELIESVLYQLPLLETYASKIDYASAMATLGGSYYMKEDYAKSIEYYGQFIDNLFDGIRQQFRMLDAHDRMNVWNHLKSDLTEMGELSCVYPADEDLGTNKLNAMLYDAQLLAKGILLNSSIAFNRVLKESGNTQLLELYDQLKEQEYQLADMRQNAMNEDDLKAVLQLQQEVTAKQIKLYDGCAEFADYTEYMSYRWQDVQKKLTGKDVAIEFVALAGPEDLLPDDRTMYALVLDAQGKQPYKVKIGTIKQLKSSLSDHSCFMNAEAGILIWGNLQSLLKGKQRIYFAADALFNNIGIEYLLIDGQPISERYEMYRLSSTKELCYNHKKPSYNNIVLMGDIDYGQLSSTIDSQHLQQLMAMRGVRESESGFDPLPFTQQEINGIKVIYSNRNPLVFAKQEASELSLRNLDDKKVNMLHISTHGSYMGSDKTTDKESMDLSILALSGANEGSDDPENDGIISAADIAELNLRHCELAVLSACQTGLGHQGDDGVFGLQRGFKNAGVHTLLITLASVYDESTAMLMEQFHKQLAANPADKRLALIKAQQYLRTHGYEAPQYWATFILLDAI